ncbi:MAG TPA: ASPIC/UnbV domain-containing protein, partial [Pyrinomonadaceae bacterium]|nr:ASPIC/UnbV domain-containing protein [Pyrinomonadaceae bacterium]
NWLAVELRGTASNRDAVGASVTLEVGNEKFTRLVSAGSGFASQQSARLYFGLGDKSQVDVMTVRWPNGRIEKFSKQPLVTRQLVRITEGAGIEVLALVHAATKSTDD